MNPAVALYIAAAIFAGMLIPLQTGLNTQLARGLQSPVLSSVAIFAVGLVFLLGMTAAMRIPLPSAAQLSGVPPLAWTGGLLAMVYVFLLITLAPKLGAAPVVACVVLGQILCSVIIDHYGLLGFELHPVSWLRVAGIVVLVAGVAMIRLS